MKQEKIQAQPVERMAFTLKETAAKLGLSYVSVWRLVRRRKLNASSALRTKLIAKTEIQRFLRDTSR